MRDFDAIVALKVEQKKWGLHPLFHIFTTIPSLWAFGPTFPWTHNNNEAMAIGDKIYNMERVGMFYPMHANHINTTMHDSLNF
jgi:hypothetical protein